MNASAIKRCLRTDVHLGHHWYEPIVRQPGGFATVYGLSGDMDQQPPEARKWYCRGDDGKREFNIWIIIEPGPGTDGPWNGQRYAHQVTVPAELIHENVQDGADSHHTVLGAAVHNAGQAAVYAYHEQMIREVAEAAGRAYLDETGRAEQRYRAEIEHIRAGYPFGRAPEPGYPVQGIVRDADERTRLPGPVYDPAKRDNGNLGYDVRQCAYCNVSIVRIEPMPGYSEWTSDVRQTAGQECPESASRNHAPLARPAPEADASQGGW